MSITAPYNFVPLSKSIFYPPWANDKKSPISHDIPFEDGESGSIDITLTSKSPIFVRNHLHACDETYSAKDGTLISKEFCHFLHDDETKEFYIPGSSFKGIIRNVLEILSFSKIKVDEKNLGQYLGVRDMTDKKMETLVGKANGLTNNKSFGYGVLYKTNDGYQFEDYGNKIRLILQRDLNKVIKKYKGGEKDVSKKYAAVSPFSKIKVKPDAKNNPQKRGFFDKYTVVPDKNGEAGELFFGGHFGKKHYEFVLLDSDKQSTNNSVAFKSDNKIINKFKAVYFDNKAKDNYVGNFWREKKKIPVFYLKSKNGSIKQFGLTQLFKVAYTKTFLDAINQEIKSSGLDLSEAIFGNEDDKKALKGRVYFGHFKCVAQNIKQKDIVVEHILGDPRPTYYPNYITQEGKNGKVFKYKTLMDSDAKISGWKRYPLQSSIQDSLPKHDKSTVKHNVTTKFKPLNSDTIFHGKIRFHNLKKVEIGALISALTFHGNSDSNMHNIGMAKSLGYGKISLDLELQTLKFTQKEYLQAFENEISKTIPEWKSSAQIRELLAMSSIHTKSTDALKYQLISNPNPKEEYTTINKKGNKVYEKNDFTGAKKAKEFLELHSKSKIFSKTKENITIKTENYKSEKKQVEVKYSTTSHSGISKTKMRKALTESWQRVFNIFYHPNQIKEFLEGEFVTTPNEQAHIYLTLKDNAKFQSIISAIDAFNKGTLKEDEVLKLYDTIRKLK